MHTQADHADNPTESAPSNDGQSFADEFVTTLQRIGALRVRVSLVCMMLPDGIGDRLRLAAQVAERISSTSVLAGVDDDGAVLVASFGPRRFGPAGDADEARRLGAVLGDALSDLLPKALGRTTVSVGHFWSDEWVGMEPITDRPLLSQVTLLRLAQSQELALAS